MSVPTFFYNVLKLHGGGEKGTWRKLSAALHLDLHTSLQTTVWFQAPQARDLLVSGSRGVQSMAVLRTECFTKASESLNCSSSRLCTGPATLTQRRHHHSEDSSIEVCSSMAGFLL